MNEFLQMALNPLAGGALGILFFGGLWWSTRRAVSARRPALWFAGSLALRMALVLSGLYLLSDGRPTPLLLALLGFVAARACVISLTRNLPDGPINPARETSHAP